ncbi:MAG: hypothetical protein MUC49_13015 [Raineya sp.]|jgi:hypothetical protein|nr:hypothetical protein [Raineya sp.]
MNNSNINKSYQESHVSIATRVPYSFKQSLLREASKLGITLSELLFDILMNNGCENFNTEELNAIKKENEALQTKILEYERLIEEKDDDELEDDYWEEYQQIKSYTESLKVAYCKLQKVAFENFAMLDFYEKSDIETSEAIQKNIIPDANDKAQNALEAVMEMLIKKNPSLAKEPKEALLKDIQDTFFENYNLQRIFWDIQPADISMRRIHLENNKYAIVESFESEMTSVEDEIISPDNFDLKEIEVLCDFEPQKTIEELIESQISSLKSDEQLSKLLNTKKAQQTIPKEIKPLPTPEKIEEKPQDQQLPEYKPKTRSESVLHELYLKGVEYITRSELKKLGFNAGLFGNLSVRGGKYGRYELVKTPSEKVYKLLVIEGK